MLTLTPCKAQLLQPREVKIELMDGSIRKATLYGYTNDAIIVKRITGNAIGKMDTLSFINIESIKVFPGGSPYTFTLTMPVAGLVIGGIIGHANEPAPTPGSIIDPGGCTTIGSALIGSCIGLGIGGLIDISRRNVIYIIHGSENNFKEFVNAYKN